MCIRDRSLSEVLTNRSYSTKYLAAIAAACCVLVTPGFCSDGQLACVCSEQSILGGEIWGLECRVSSPYTAPGLIFGLLPAAQRRVKQPCFSNVSARMYIRYMAKLKLMMPTIAGTCCTATPLVVDDNVSLS